MQTINAAKSILRECQNIRTMMADGAIQEEELNEARGTGDIRRQPGTTMGKSFIVAFQLEL